MTIEGGLYFIPSYDLNNLFRLDSLNIIINRPFCRTAIVSQIEMHFNILKTIVGGIYKNQYINYDRRQHGAKATICTAPKTFETFKSGSELVACNGATQNKSKRLVTSWRPVL